MISRHTFIRRTAAGIAAGTGLGVGYGFWEAAHVRVARHAVPVPDLPAAFAGKTVAVLADLHHGPFVGIDFIREAVRLTNELAPDLVALVGDYAHKGDQAHLQLPPCLEALSALSAPLGVFAVPGNHDMQRGGAVYRERIAATPLTDLTNGFRRVSQGGEHLFVAGVDDLWWGKPNLDRALDGVRELESPTPYQFHRAGPCDSTEAGKHRAIRPTTTERIASGYCSKRTMPATIM